MRPTWGIPSYLLRIEYHSLRGQCQSRVRNQCIILEFQAARVSAPLGIDERVACDWGCYHSGHRLDVVKAVHGLQTKVRGQWRVKKWLGEKCPHPLPYPAV